MICRPLLVNCFGVLCDLMVKLFREENDMVNDIFVSRFFFTVFVANCMVSSIINIVHVIITCLRICIDFFKHMKSLCYIII